MGRKAPRKRLTCRVTACPTGASHAPERLSALRPPLDWGERSQNANPGRKSAPRERAGLFDMVKNAATVLVLILRACEPIAFEVQEVMRFECHANATPARLNGGDAEMPGPCLIYFGFEPLGGRLEQPVCGENIVGQ